jgi:Fe-S-cluster containining protein
MGDRCTGRCCESFTLTGIGYTPGEIDAFLRMRATDGVQIADMVIPLRRIVAGAEVPNGSQASCEPTGGGWVFTCKHFDLVNRDCGIYETRPGMCRDFPYGSRCEHGERCGWDAGREGLHPPPRAYYREWTPVHEIAEPVPEAVKAEGDPSILLITGGSTRTMRVHLATIDATGRQRRAASEHERMLEGSVGC